MVAPMNCPRCDTPLADDALYGPCQTCRNQLNQLYSQDNNFKKQRAAVKAAKKAKKEAAVND